MGSQGTSPALEPKRQTAKKWFFRAAGFGAGFAVAIAVIVGIFAWYSSRPKPEKPWNTKAITAAYEGLASREEEKSIYLMLTYSLENTTDSDYRIPGNTKMMLRRNKGNLEEVGKDLVIWDTFIPSHHKVVYKFSVPVGDIFDVVKANKNESEMIKFLSEQLKQIDGFVMFDELNRYEIVFPSGWNTLSNTAAGTTPTPAGPSQRPLIGATKVYRGFVYAFDGSKWKRGGRARRYDKGDLKSWSDDQYDPLNLLSREEKAKRPLSETQIRQVANQFGVSYEEAWEDAKQQGYQVPSK